MTTTALNAEGAEIPPTKGATAVCQDCGQPVRAKCGSIVVPHWAHFPRTDTDSFSEGETAWHWCWKALVQVSQREVVLVRNGQTHRADLIGNYYGIQEVVVELQHSPISPEEAEKREQFYGEMIWIFDATPFLGQLNFYKASACGGWPHLCLNWKRERPSIAARKRTTYLDVGGDLLYRLDSNYGKGIGFLGQMGTFVAKAEFLMQVFGNLLSPEGIQFVQNPRKFQPPNRKASRPSSQ